MAKEVNDARMQELEMFMRGKQEAYTEVVTVLNKINEGV